MAIRDWGVAHIVSWAATWMIVVAIGTSVIENYEAVSDTVLVITALSLVVGAILTLVVQLRWLTAGKHRRWHPGKLVIVGVVAAFGTAWTLLAGIHPDTKVFLSLVFLGPLWIIVLAMIWTYLGDVDGRSNRSMGERGG